MRASINVLGGPLAPCSDTPTNPTTGWFRDGSCNTDENDRGKHTVCVELTEDFLAFSKARGNDLSTPMPEHGFPGLRPGDKWCLCAARWKEAYDAGKAPKVYIAATHEETLTVVPLAALKQHAIDLN